MLHIFGGLKDFINPSSGDDKPVVEGFVAKLHYRVGHAHSDVQGRNFCIRVEHAHLDVQRSEFLYQGRSRSFRCNEFGNFAEES